MQNKPETSTSYTNNTFPFFRNLLLDLSSISQYLFLLSSLIFKLSFLYINVSASGASLALVLGVLPSLYSVNYCSECHLYIVCSLDLLRVPTFPIPFQFSIWQFCGHLNLDKMKPLPLSPAWFDFSKWHHETAQAELGVISKTLLSSLLHSHH